MSSQKGTYFFVSGVGKNCEQGNHKVRKSKLLYIHIIITTIPSEMEVAPRYKLLTQLTLLTPFTLLTWHTLSRGLRGTRGTTGTRDTRDQNVGVDG